MILNFEFLLKCWLDSKALTSCKSYVRRRFQAFWKNNSDFRGKPNEQLFPK